MPHTSYSIEQQHLVQTRGTASHEPTWICVATPIRIAATSKDQANAIWQQLVASLPDGKNCQYVENERIVRRLDRNNQQLRIIQVLKHHNASWFPFAYSSVHTQHT